MADIPKDIRDYTNTRARTYDTPFSFPESNKYSISQLAYPTGVGQTPDLQHYVTFFINVRGKSKFKGATVKDVNFRHPLNSRADALINEGRAVEAGALLAGGATVKKAITDPGQALKSGAKTFGGLALTAGPVIAAQSMADILKKDNKERLKDVITLHMEERPSVKYGVNYQDKDMGILGGFLTDTASVSESLTSQAGELGSALALQFAKIPSMLPGFGSAGLGDIAQQTAKVKTNPFREVFFEGVDYRTFNFKYKFMPKDTNESKAVYSIIETFKQHMHPELSNNGYFYIYPSEFEIRYYYKNKENPYFNKISQCALTDMSIDYGGDQFASFSDGSPTEINMTLSFRELELMTKESIREGY
jgi:hypothetical protein